MEGVDEIKLRRCMQILKKNHACMLIWLVLKDRLSTRNLLNRRNMQLQSINCALCQGTVEETIEHLFLSCPFSAQCWNLVSVDIENQTDMLQAVYSIKTQVSSPFFFELTVLMTWAIWITRNNLIFNGIQPQINTVKEIFEKEIRILSLRAKARSVAAFDLWVL